MRERDSWKKKAKYLSIQNKSVGVSHDESVAWNQYRSLRNKVNNAKKNEEYKYKRFMIDKCEGDSKQTWNSIKHFMDWKYSGPPNQIVAGNIIHRKAKEVATLMNDYFIEKVTCLKDKFKESSIDLRGCQKAMHSKRCKLQLDFISVKKVEKLISNIKSSKAVAIDELDSYSLKISSKYIAAPIHHLITLSVMQQKFPSAWKLSKVLPLHKKGCPLEKKNYRPVSILSPVSKILERVVYDQVYSYFAKNRIFHPNVMSFRRNRSTLTSILQMYDRWVRGAGDGGISGVVFLDLSAAFDLVDSSLLIQKLIVYGVQPDVISWIDSYLANRKQAVWIDHTLSDWQDVPVGVPQGSILGPLLFTIFSNDLPEFLSCEIDQYADDSTLSCVKSAAGEITSELNSNLCEVSKWMQSNKMCLNVDKTHLMLAGTNHRILRTNAEETLDIRIDQVQLQPSVTNCERVLGVIVQPNLKWIEHANDLQGKLKFRLAGLRKVTHALDYEKRKVVAKAIFESVLTYCIPVWAGTSKGVIEELQVLQNRAAQFVLKLPGRSNRDHMFNTLGWLTVHQLSVFHTWQIS